ncbi:hypothetical protein ACFZCP_18915 [Streptomyces sp. NPDC007971]|uniref:hypothetical protein n=1 Tax=Streptomyces sp. NPDC007971 TaxID=3364799 RepID=UPI0036E1AEE8
MADGKFDPAHLKQPAEKEAQEKKLGLSGPSDGGSFATPRVWRGGKLYLQAAARPPPPRSP